MAHRCYHQWSVKARKQIRNGYGVMLCVKSEQCERCNTVRTVSEPVREDVKEEHENETALAMA